ncbi:hypothetical protein KDW_17760 [Dictyobacter vulcani]|uniref:Uncharacterized protein n=1 Tax=Dictyobacter vulcani TaxID=2607529 RepID=A0A5J4KED4_9CHLR|nr:hypothetical protein KDW_17760 [Dictyobacter vulcani]
MPNALNALRHFFCLYWHQHFVGRAQLVWALQHLHYYENLISVKMNLSAVRPVANLSNLVPQQPG